MRSVMVGSRFCRVDPCPPAPRPSRHRKLEPSDLAGLLARDAHGWSESTCQPAGTAASSPAASRVDLSALQPARMHPCTADDRGPRAEPGRTGRMADRARRTRSRAASTTCQARLPVRDVLRRPGVSLPESADEGPPGRDRPRPHRAPRRSRHRSLRPRPLFGGSGARWSSSTAVSRPGVVSHKGKDFAVAFPWYTEQLRRRHRLVFNFSVDELPPEAKAEQQFAARTGLRSHTVLPMAVGDRSRSAPSGVASVTGVRVWSREFLSRLELLASVFAAGPLPPPRRGAHHGRRGAEPRDPPRAPERGRACSTATGGSSR